MTKRESCVLCAVKHLAQARVLLIEAAMGYQDHYYFALGHIAEAEAELIKDHPALANHVRDIRKRLEDDPYANVSWGKQILEVANVGERRVTRMVKAIEREYYKKSRSDLIRWWTERVG